MNLDELRHELRAFAAERNWEPFHTPKNLVMALSGEVGELTDLFQWLTPEESRRAMEDDSMAGDIADELADVVMYLVRLADVLGVDLMAATESKLARNHERFPPPD